MKRPHRRLHLMIWVALTPAVLAGLFLALSATPPAPVSDIPSSIATEAP